MVITSRRKLKRKQQRIEELEKKLDELEKEKKKLEDRFEAEKNRRSKLATEKQQAEEELNRLKDKIEGLESSVAGEKEVEEDSRDIELLSFEKAYRVLEKLDAVESSDQDMVTVYSPGKVREIDDFRGLKNSVSKRRMKAIQDEKSFAAFIDEDIFEVLLKTRPFFGDEWFVSHEFLVGRLLEFIEKEKTWALVQSGETEIYSEKAGEVEKIDTVKNRVDRDHSKGGFSQGRFERKRDEQIQEHIDQVKEVLEIHDDVYLLGEKDLCKQLEGEYLGGFDSNKPLKQQLYSFRLVR